MVYWVYILKSVKLDRFYTGSTSDLVVRMNFHKNTHSRKFTSKAKDWELYLKIECESKPQALAIERHIKLMKSKTYIENLKIYPEMMDKLLKRYKSET